MQNFITFNVACKMFWPLYYVIISGENYFNLICIRRKIDLHGKTNSNYILLVVSFIICIIWLCYREYKSIPLLPVNAVLIAYSVHQSICLNCWKGVRFVYSYIMLVLYTIRLLWRYACNYGLDTDVIHGNGRFTRTNNSSITNHRYRPR